MYVYLKRSTGTRLLKTGHESCSPASFLLQSSHPPVCEMSWSLCWFVFWGWKSKKKKIHHLAVEVGQTRPPLLLVWLLMLMFLWCWGGSSCKSRICLLLILWADVFVLLRVRNCVFKTSWNFSAAKNCVSLPLWSKVSRLFHPLDVVKGVFCCNTLRES